MPHDNLQTAAPPVKPSRPSLKPLMGLWPRLIAHRRMLVLAGVALLTSSLAMLAIPMAVRRMIDAGFTTNNGQLIDQYFAMLILLGLVLALASSGRFYSVTWLGERVVADIRAEVFGHLARLSPAFFEQTHSGELMSRLTADTTQIKSAAGSALSQALRNAIMLIGALALMFVTSVQLSLLVLVAIPAIALPLVAYGGSSAACRGALRIRWRTPRPMRARTSAPSALCNPRLTRLSPSGVSSGPSSSRSWRPRDAWRREPG